MRKENKIPKVLRITIDERLSENLIRLEICKLVDIGNSGEFKDEPGFWKDAAKEGEEILVQSNISKHKSRKKLYTDLMSIPKSQVDKFPWKDLKEGQVFLSGEFEVKEKMIKNKNVKQYFIHPGKESFEQIDDDVKENTKNLYFEILAKGDKYGRL